jgi:hypothetical protein
MPDYFPIVTSENGTRYHIWTIYEGGDGWLLPWQLSDPDDYSCDLAKCARPATYADDFSRWCEVHEPLPVEVAHAD